MKNLILIKVTLPNANVLFVTLGKDENTQSHIGMSDTSSNSSIPVTSSCGAASALPLKPNQRLESAKLSKHSTHEDDETPPLLPRNICNQTGPNRPLPASPPQQMSPQR